MRKLILMIAASIFFICSNTTYANSFELTVENKTAKSGETVTINLDFSNNTGIIAALFKLEYDRERLELVKAEDKGLLEGAVFSQNYDSFPYIMLWNSASEKNFTSDGTLAALTFRILDNAEGGSAVINISYNPDDVFDSDLNNVDIHINNVSITVLNESSSETEAPVKENTVSTSGGYISSGSSKPKETHNSTNSTDAEIVPATNTISFDDVKEHNWYYSDVTYVVEKKLMNGISDTHFAPDNLLTRGMLVTVLYRNENRPDVGADVAFSDVTGNMYYADAVAWAKQNGIVNGVTEYEFAPDNNITREQIVTIMHRYAKYKKYDVGNEKNTNILSYDDFSDISEYAIASMQYAIGSGLMNGKTESTLNPLDNATRAEIAAILHRFIETNSK